MQWIYGKNDTAIIHTSDVEKKAINQVKQMCDHIVAKDAHIRIMPDVHAGFGCVVGYTARVTKYIIPSLIGIDIGCGVRASRIPYKILDLQQFFKGLDAAIRGKIPSGMGKQKTKAFDSIQLQQFYAKTELAKQVKFVHFFTFLQNMQKKFGKTLIIDKSIGTLGGGNHFIEVDQDTSNQNLYLTIHTGSRVFGFMVAMYYKQQCQCFEYDIKSLFDKIQRGEMVEMEESVYPDLYDYAMQHLKATIKEKKIEQLLKTHVKTFSRKGELKFLSGKRMEDYIQDMKIAQAYASINRQCIESLLLEYIDEYAVQQKLERLPPSGFPEQVESVHNYIDFGANVIRKGAISAQKDEFVIIPLNMRDGVILGYGLGNDDWNCSAPHGSGRKMSRTDAKYGLSLEAYKQQMAGIYSTSVGVDTLDEAPDAYKNSNILQEFLQESVHIVKHLKSVFNFKAGQEEEAINPYDEDINTEQQ